MEQRELTIAKFGTSSVVEGRYADVEKNARENISWFVDQLSKMHETSDVIVVSSGAVALGKAMLPDMEEQTCKDKDADQFFATHGNPFLMTMWISEFKKKQIPAGELLLTHPEIDDDAGPETPGTEMRAALNRMRALGAVAIVNENDPLSREELYERDNDGLAGHIARSLGASACYFMTQCNVRDGFDIRIKKVVTGNVQSETAVLRHAGGPGPSGRGGMRSKVREAIALGRAGIPSYIAPAQSSFDAIRQGRSGTYFVPSARTSTLEPEQA